jgi:hypothetical protein
MNQSKEREGHFICPVGKLFSEIDRISRRDSEFMKHMKIARIEFLKAIRSIIDEKIQSLEKNIRTKTKKKATRIEVE